jgi:hypothetical protein
MVDRLYPPEQDRVMLMTKHENETFTNVTVYLSGQAFIGCKFVGCTLILRETVCHLDNCGFDRCNWHIDRLVTWGNPDNLRELKAVVGLIDQLQQQHAAAAQTTGGNGGEKQA